MKHLLAQNLQITGVDEAGNPYSVSFKGPLKDSIGSISDLINLLLSIMYPIAGVILFFMIVIGGFKWMSSQGEPDKLDSARKYMTNGVVGFVLLALSFFLVRLIAFVFGLDGGGLFGV